MERYSHINAFDDLVGDTWVIGVELVTLLFQNLSDILVIYQACRHCTVDFVLMLYNYLLDTLAVRNNIRSIYVWGNI